MKKSLNRRPIKAKKRMSFIDSLERLNLGRFTKNAPGYVFDRKKFYDEWWKEKMARSS